MKQVRFDHPGLAGLSGLGIGIFLAVAAGYAVNGWRNADDRRIEAEAMTGGVAARAPALLRRYGCSGCHEISGIPGADGRVGGSLDGLRERVFIAGVLPNSPDNLLRWIVNPERQDPRTAMPSTGIGPAEARDVAAYLYSR
ncbi:c-type cytochrome [Gellertiella hungarica]|uniref:Mono/diheme cytochrome c family protein n=1 Tax=Gellertiella hungarica TaxID=1572859 RepID=A0A7W6J877_9HYPH|nr:mono/diheme cytochrome c family protein [Gellertiella hungarica]